MPHFWTWFGYCTPPFAMHPARAKASLAPGVWTLGSMLDSTSLGVFVASTDGILETMGDFGLGVSTRRHTNQPKKLRRGEQRDKNPKGTMATTNFTSIPTIDLSLASSPTTKPKLLSQLRHALVSIGFLYITNHDISPSTITSLTAALPPLFALPASAKQEAALENSPHFLGYSGTGSETTAGVADLREQFEFCTPHTFSPSELTSDGKSRKKNPNEPLYEQLKGPNQYPASFPDLESIVETYITSLTNLSTTFLTLVAESLNLPSSALHTYLSDTHRLKLVHYPPNPSSSSTTLARVQGVGPHKDSSGWFTFLLQASPPHVDGLQALNKRGDWIDVPNVPGTLVVNIGQGFEVITNGVCKATVHRVLGTRSERFSVPFFLGLRRDLRRGEAVGGLGAHFAEGKWRGDGEEGEGGEGVESAEGREVDSAWLTGRYDVWGEAQLRTKIRSHRDVGRRFYEEVFEGYVGGE
ncbi:Clavaminate synthase-like protein [Periconia macrospinosa]|uniref:Clavaminate synthase-like protein n=1 Tax=Periconia macrospinosa TaxID=97972 RepID=A0A2V1D6L9_9PLEO|nr:Clavaminate synthase-like protein [Periconia macrospinosa]